MSWKRRTGVIAGAIVPLALAVQSVLALGDVPPERATPEPPDRPGAIDPGFVARAGENVDPGFIVAFEDRSNDSGFFAGAGRFAPLPAPAPDPAPATPAITLGAP